MQPETRFIKTTDLECRQLGAELVIEGYSPVFERYSRNLGGFVEKVEKRSVSQLLQDDQIITYNHDLTGPPLARRGAGTADISADDYGVHYRARLGSGEYARRVYDAVERGDAAGSSFTFAMGVTPDGEPGDAWTQTEEGYLLRSLRAIRVIEMGPVTTPAYFDAPVDVSRALSGLVSESRSLDALVSAAKSGALTQMIFGESGDGSENRAIDPEVLAAKKRKLIELRNWQVARTAPSRT